ncbi:MAG: large conductance mechanosensitive channel [Patiriisocius sp.]|jgi:large conductance mechanosensitive channel
MIKILKEFKEFAVKGNMVEIAIGVILGASFNKVVNVLVKDIFMPPLAFLTSGLSWADQKFVLQESILDQQGAVLQSEVALGYGKLIEASIDFLVIGLTVFVVVKMMNRIINKSQDVKDTTIKTPKNIELLHEMTELLKSQNEILKSK